MLLQMQVVVSASWSEVDCCAADETGCEEKALVEGAGAQMLAPGLQVLQDSVLD